jgi:mannose-1-phosphate guanylyltransferase
VPAARLRALVLAAGLGTRLRPLTESHPKPLLPVVGVPILGHTLAQLAAVGCEAVAVNLHYQGEQIRQRFGDSFGGIPLTWSEEPELLGTGGALHPLRDFLAPADLILLINGDSLCRWPLKRLIRAHQAGGATATLLLTRRADPEVFGGGVGIGREGEILSFRRGDPPASKTPPPPDAPSPIVKRWVFAGAHVFAPALLERVGPAPSDIVRDLYMPLLAQGGRLGSVITARPWHDLGTPRRFLDATLEWARAGWPERLWRRSWVSQEAGIAAGAKLHAAAVEAGARVGEGARVERSVLLPGARVGEGSTLYEVILGYGAAVPPGSRVERRIVTRRRDGTPPSLDDSVVGGVVYTPLDPAGSAE